MQLDQRNNSLEIEMPNIVEHSTFVSYDEEIYKASSKPTHSATIVDAVMQDSCDEKAFCNATSPDMALNPNDSCFGSQSDDTVKPDHLAPTEETSKKLQLSLDELIQQKELKLLDWKRHSRKNIPKQHRGGRRYVNKSDGRTNASQKKKLGRRTTVYGNVNGHRKTYFPHPHLTPYGVMSLDPMDTLPMNLPNTVFSRCAPMHGARALNNPFRFPGSLSNFSQYKMIPNVQVNGTLRHPGYFQQFVSPQLQRTSIDALTLAKDSALSEVEILFPPLNEDGTGPSPLNALVVKFKNTEVLIVRKLKGDMVLSSGGWRTLSTQLVLNSALKPLGLWIEARPMNSPEAPKITETEQGAGNELLDESKKWEQEKLNESVPYRQRPGQQWTVVDGKFYLAKFEDGMVIGQIGASSRSQLMARASVVAQHLKQVKNNAMARRQRHMAYKSVMH